MQIYEKKSSDNLATTKSNESKRLHNRVLVLTLVVLTLFLLLGGKLFYLQVIQVDKYTTLSDQNQLRIVSTPARRGDIFDRNQIPLATSKPMFAVAIADSELKSSDYESLSNNLAAILNDPAVPAEFIQKSLTEHVKNYEPVIICRYKYDEKVDILTKIEENRESLPGVFIIAEPRRYYPLGNVAGHILGSVGLISSDEQYLVDQYDYLLNDWIGKTGLEKTMERFTNAQGTEIGLRGKRGVQKIEVNSKHQPVRVRETIAAVSGNSMTLSIDAGVQKAMEDSLNEAIATAHKQNSKAVGGAAVMIDVKTGAIIALASAPQVNPNDFANGLSSDLADYYWDAQLKPTYNRAISATYPPGSTFKPITATAIMASGLLSPNYTVTCNSSAWKPPKAKCPYAHGTVNLQKAMAVSCNAYFQEAAAKIGIENLYSICYKLGYGQQSGIELPGEAKGILPNPEWKSANFKGWEKEWRLYDTYYMAMGQGYNSDTPLQMASAIATIANDGVRMKPYLVDQVVNADEEVVYKAEPSVSADLKMDKATMKVVKDAMLSVTEVGGTAHRLFTQFPFGVAAKTGTAQTGLVGDDEDKDYHGWFVSFAPFDDPQVAFACVIEYGYHGGTSAGTVCKASYEEYFKLNEQPIVDVLKKQVDEVGL